MLMAFPEATETPFTPLPTSLKIVRAPVLVSATLVAPVFAAAKLPTIVLAPFSVVPAALTVTLPVVAIEPVASVIVPVRFERNILPLPVATAPFRAKAPPPATTLNMPLLVLTAPNVSPAVEST